MRSTKVTGPAIGRWKRRGLKKFRLAVIETLEQRALLSTSTLVYAGADGRLVYTPNASGDVIPNFSMVGYQTGSVPLPDTAGGVSVPVKATVNPGAAGVDMTATIQAAINTVSAMSLDANGFRGAVLLTAGNYPISGQLNINASGVVLEGQGNNKTTGTALEATGTTTRQLIEVAGSGSRSTVSNTTHNITDSYVPVGASSFHLDSAANLHVGDTIIVNRPSPANWIHDIGMDQLAIPWTAGSKDQNWDRVITAINGNQVTIDVPLTNSLDQQYGGGSVHRYTWSGRINQVGIENMYIYSDSASLTDLLHATGSMTLDSLTNGWVQNITSDGFATNQIVFDDGTKWCTIENCVVENTSQGTQAPPAGVSFNGQQLLGENLTFHGTYHALALGATVPGPNVMVNATADGKGAGVGPHQRWATGGLLDNFFVTGTQIQVVNAGNSGTGHGWEGANFVLWNCGTTAAKAQEIDVYNPPTAQNWVIGGSATTTQGDGIFDQYNSTVQPQSLYLKQLWDRMHLNPTLATPATATPNPRSGSTTSLSVLGADASVGEAGLTYTWSVVSKPSGAANPTFSANGTNAAKNSVATFSAAGAYVFQVMISDAGGLLATSSVIVTDRPTITINGDQDSANENDTFLIARNGSFVDVTRNGVVALHQDYASSPEIAIEALGGNDTITVDYTGGNPVPANGLILDGGSGAGDVVSVVTTSGSDAISLAVGSATVNGGQFGYAGAEELDLAAGAGTDTLTVTGGNTAVTAGIFALNVSGGGSLAMAASSALPDFTDLNVSGATFSLFGQNETIDSLNGNGTIDNGAAGAAPTLTVGQHNGSGTFSGVLTNGAGSLALTKNGTGALTLSGNNGYTGPTTINGGEIASGNSASLAALTGAVVFNGGTFHVTANTISANVANKYTTSFTGATSGSTATFNIDAGVTLTVGTVGGSAGMRTNGGGAHGGDFFKTGLGTLDILSNNGQQDNPFELQQGTIILESATGLGGGDAGVQLDAMDGTGLVLRQDVSTNFLTPINIDEVGATVSVVIDRKTAGAAVTHSLNTLTSAGAFTLVVSTGTNITSGIGGFTLGSATLGGDGIFATAGGAMTTITGAVSGAFAVTSSGGGTLTLAGANTYTGTTTANAGSTLAVTGSLPATAVMNANGIVNIAGNPGNTLLARSLAALNIGSGGLTKALPSVFPGTPEVFTIASVTFASAGAKFDMTNNELLTTSTAAVVRASIIVGQLFTSSNSGAIGYNDLGGGTIEARFTLPGDTNLDGTVNVSDLGNLASNYGLTAGANWANGDSDYNGKIDVADLGNLASNFGASLATGSDVSSGDLQDSGPKLIAQTIKPIAAGAQATPFQSNISITNSSAYEPAQLGNLTGMASLIGDWLWQQTRHVSAVCDPQSFAAN